MSISEFIFVTCGGALANSIEAATTGQPLVRLYTKIQEKPELSVRASWKEARRDGIYRGVIPLIGLAGAKGAIRWGASGATDLVALKFFSSGMDQHHPFVFKAFAGGISALFTVTITCPIERFRILRMTTKLGESALEIVREQGIFSLYRGYRPMVGKESISWFVYLWAYGWFHKFYAAKTNDRRMLQILAGASTGITCGFFQTTVDMIKTQQQKKDSITEKRVFYAMQQMIDRYGWKGLMRSAGVKALRSGAYGAVTIVLVDQLVGLPKIMQTSSRS